VVRWEQEECQAIAVGAVAAGATIYFADDAEIWRKLKLFFLPGCSPELNRDEQAGITSKDNLKAKAVGALRRLQQMPRLDRTSVRKQSYFA
jgi:hypothetical protein